MPITIAYDKDKEILFSYVVGEITAEQHEQCLTEIMQSSDIPSNANALWDLMEMDFSVVDIELEKEIIKVREILNERRGNAKVALVSNYKLGEPMLKLFTILAKHLDQPIRVSTTREEAALWLCADC